MSTTLFRSLAAAALLAAAAAPSHAAEWASSERYGSWNYGAYNFNNDIWGDGAGPQTIWVNSNADWGVWANHPNTGGIKSYPHVMYNVNRRVSALNALTANVNATTPSGGAWASAFDIWSNDKRLEVMLWLNYTGTSNGCGNVKPISYNWESNGCARPIRWNVSVGGATWNIYRGTNGSADVVSFLRTSKTNRTAVDVRAIMRYLLNQGMISDVTVGEVQYGFEITSSSGGMNFHSRDFWVTAY